MGPALFELGPLLYTSGIQNNCFMLYFCLMLRQILAIRAQVEDLGIDEESLAYLGEIGQQASLRFVLHFLVTFSRIDTLNESIF